MSNPWIEWNGGDCPVALDTEVDWKLRKGRVLRARDYDWTAKDLDWAHNNSDSDIIAYRVVKS